MQNNQNRNSASSFGGKQPIALIPQLMQQTAGMQHVDDIFAWLMNAIAQNWNISVAQFWAIQAYELGQAQTEIRATASQSNSVPQQLHINQPVVTTITQLLQEQRSATPLILTHFSSTQASVLAQYGMMHWTCQYLNKDILLPPAKNTLNNGKFPISTPLNAIISLFARYPMPAELVRAVSFLAEQALRIATVRGFVSTTSQATGPTTPIPLSATTPTPPVAPTTSVREKPRQPAQLALTDLIPRRTQSKEESWGESSLISRRARRIYVFVDGQKTITQISRITSFSSQEIIEAFGFLLKENLIMLYTPDGELIESSFLISHFL